MQNLSEMIDKLFFPFRKELNVLLVSNDESNCMKLNSLLNSIFDNNDSVLNLIGNLQYFKENEIFNFVVDNKTIIRFSINIRVVDLIDKDAYCTHDILIPIFCLNKYASFDYDNTITETDYIISEFLKTGKPIIASYLNTEYIFNISITDEEQWQKSNNILHKLLIDYENSPSIYLTQQGRSILKGLSKIFQYYSMYERKFYITQKINFFTCNANEIEFGKNEFILNLLMQMLNLNKIDEYNFILTEHYESKHHLFRTFK